MPSWWALTGSYIAPEGAGLGANSLSRTVFDAFVLLATNEVIGFNGGELNDVSSRI